MTPADRRALAAALRHGREHYAFRPGWYRGRREYLWYLKPFNGLRPRVLRASDLGDGVWMLAFTDKWSANTSVAVDSVGFALSVLAFFGVYQPAMAEVTP